MRQRIFGAVFCTAAAVLALCLIIVCILLHGNERTLFSAMGVFAIGVAVSAVCAYAIAQKTIEPIKKIDLDDPVGTNKYEELSAIAERIADQNDKIKMQMGEIMTEHSSQDRMRREFTANVSHELKTPLTSISGYAEIIRDGLVKPEDIPRFAGRIHDEARRLIALVGDIIKLSQLDEGAVDTKQESIELYGLCDTIAESLRPIAKKRDVTVEMTGERMVVRGSEQIMGEMIYNLCDNAIKYNRTGGKVVISVAPDERGAATVSVADTGIGIPQDECERVFERFYRVNKSHSKEIGGTGLGLSIVKHGALFHDAEITMESAVGVGTCVSLRFKNADAADSVNMRLT